MVEVDSYLAQEWEQYRKAVLIGPITNAELLKSKYHFYAGALGILAALKGIKGVPKEQGQQIINSVNREIKLFLAHGHQTL